MRSPQRLRRGAHAAPRRGRDYDDSRRTRGWGGGSALPLRGSGRHRAPGLNAWAARNPGTPLRLAAAAALSAAAVGMALTGPVASATVDVGVAGQPMSPGAPAGAAEPAGHGAAPSGSGPGTGGGVPDRSHPAGSGAAPDSSDPNDLDPSDPEPSDPEPVPGPEPDGADPVQPDAGEPAEGGDPAEGAEPGEPAAPPGPAEGAGPAGPAGPPGPAERAGPAGPAGLAGPAAEAGGDGLGARWPDTGVAPADPDTVDQRVTDDAVATDRLAATADSPRGDGPSGLLAFFATICVVGVSAGAVRVMIARRAASGMAA